MTGRNCSACDKYFSTNFNLSSHIQRLHQPKNDEQKEKKEKLTSRKRKNSFFFRWDMKSPHVGIALFYTVISLRVGIAPDSASIFSDFKAIKPIVRIII